MDTLDDFDFLSRLRTTDPDFVKKYMENENKNLTVMECANILGVCNNSVLNYIKSGKIKATKSGHIWLIDKIDFFAFKQSVSIAKKRNKSFITINNQETLDKNMSIDFTYEKATSRTITDFLHNWHRSKSAGFALATICRDFNDVSSVKTNETQMSNILSSLVKKGIVIRKGKGLYQVSPSIISEEKQVGTESVSLNQKDSSIIVDADIEPAPILISKNCKQEKLAIESFIRNNRNPHLDFSFNISDVCRSYPHLDRKKIGKACSNMHQSGKLKKGLLVGDYIRPATPPVIISTAAPTVAPVPAPAAIAPVPKKLIDSLQEQSDILDKIKKIISSNLDSNFKIDYIQKLF